MPRWLKLTGIVVGVLMLVVGGAAYWLFAPVYHAVQTLEHAEVTDDVSVVYGFGSNVGVLRTSVGPVVVDTMTFHEQGERLRALVEEIGGGKTVAVINTHYHQDHTHGNPAWPRGTSVVATARTRHHLLTRDGEYWTGEAESLLPAKTFDTEWTSEIGGKTVRAIHYGRGHTDGDLVVLFPQSGVLHTGDLFFNLRYPNIDLEAGGSVEHWITTLDRVLALEFEHVIPGHGDVTNRAGLVAFQDFLKELWSVGQEAAKNGASLDETLAGARLTRDAGYEAMTIPFVLRLDRDFVVRRVWEEATGAVKPAA